MTHEVDLLLSSPTQHDAEAQIRRDLSVLAVGVMAAPPAPSQRRSHGQSHAYTSGYVQWHHIPAPESTFWSSSYQLLLHAQMPLLQTGAPFCAPTHCSC